MSSILHETQSLYHAADREVAAAGPVCISSGRCCRFKEYGHVLFISNLEAAVLLREAPAYEQPVTADFCPFQKENLCTAREPRPLGCRVYYCDPNYQETGNRITETYLHRLKELAEKHGVPWKYAPLHHFLNHPEEALPDDCMKKVDHLLENEDMSHFLSRRLSLPLAEV